jgi:hypothetical protein
MKNKWMLIWGAILAALAFLWKFALVLLAVYITVAIIKKIFFNVLLVNMKKVLSVLDGS